MSGHRRRPGIYYQEPAFHFEQWDGRERRRIPRPNKAETRAMDYLAEKARLAEMQALDNADRLDRLEKERKKYEPLLEALSRADDDKRWVLKVAKRVVIVSGVGAALLFFGKALWHEFLKMIAGG